MMEAERAIDLLEKIKKGSIATVHLADARIALEMAINALERQRQSQRAIEALQEKSAKYAEMYLETAPDTEDHILDRIRYRAAADIYANAANMVKVLLRWENDD